MIQIRRAADRGNSRTGWLNSYHSFSFSDYYDERHMGFSALRVINEDSVKPGTGFGAHSHRDMEILSYVLEGSLAHRDSTGGEDVIRAGEWQRMSAGSGITHSEFNGSKTDPVHFLQIWIIPERKGITPGYEQKGFSTKDRTGRWCLIASPQGDEGSLVIHQDAKVYDSLLSAGSSLQFELKDKRYVWLQLVQGEANVLGASLRSSDGAAIRNESGFNVEAKTDSEVILFDLP